MMLYISSGVKVTSLLKDLRLPPLRDFALGRESQSFGATNSDSTSLLHK